VIAGSIELPGAALLAGLGAMRSGAGLVRVATSDSVVGMLASAIPELVWLPLDEEAPGLIAPAGWRRATSEAAANDAVIVGPGLGRHPSTQRRARQLIASLSVPGVVDADGLNALAQNGTWWQGQRAPLILTPHPGEFGRLTGEPAPDADDDDGRATAAAEAAATWGQVVVLKGANTVVADPGGEVLRAEVATPALATAGSGDVLAGAIGALLAAGAAPFVAAACGVAVHGAAGMIAAERIGSTGAMARDLAGFLPASFARLRGERAQ